MPTVYPENQPSIQDGFYNETGQDSTVSARENSQLAIETIGEVVHTSGSFLGSGELDLTEFD